MKGLNAFNLQNAQFVILGSFPGELSLCSGQYYANSTNQFWDLLDIDKTLCYESRLDELRKHGIGLWDVIESCERDGSADKNIKNITYNNLSVLKDKTVLFNGKRAYKYFLTAKKQQNIDLYVSEKQILPSSSPAYPMTFKTKQTKWNKVIKK